MVLSFFFVFHPEENGLFFIETSALDSSHVEEAFIRILEGNNYCVIYIYSYFLLYLYSTL